MRRENFYRRDPGLALQGMSSMSLEERGVYNTVIDLLYLTWRPLEDDPGYIAGHCRCAVQKLNPILKRLIDSEKLVRFVENGRSYISNPTFERERTEVKGPSKTRSGRASVEEKSGEVGEKSAGVSENLPLLDIDSEQKQHDTALDRVDQSRQEANASLVVGTTPKGRKARKQTVYPLEFEEVWLAYPHTQGRSSKPNSLDEWRLLPADQREGLPAAIAAFRPNVARACGDRGAPCMSRWLKDGKHLNWTASTASSAPAPGPAFTGPAELRARILALTDPEFVAGYIDPAGWDAAERALIARTKFGADEIRRRLRAYLAEKKITVTVVGQPARQPEGQAA